MAYIPTHNSFTASVMLSMCVWFFSTSDQGSALVHWWQQYLLYIAIYVHYYESKHTALTDECMTLSVSQPL